VRGADVLPFTAVFTYERKDSLPDELDTAKFYSIEADDNQSNAAVEREILAALGEKPLNLTEIKKAVKDTLPKVGLKRIRDLVDRMAAGKRIAIGEGTKPNEKVYRLV
jgi:hypothetical protein